MSTNPVNNNTRQVHAAPVTGRAATRYSTLARVLTEEIETGRYEVGDKIPTEAELQQRFDVSRHTVREALRELKGRGLILARAGVGTVVRAKPDGARLLQGIGTLEELVQFVEATRMQILRHRVVVADESLAKNLTVKAGQELHVASVLRYLPQGTAPVASMDIYVRPEHGDVLGRIDKAGQPVFSLIERQHGTRIREVSQQVVAVVLTPADAKALKARAGQPALHITRQYLDSQDRLVMASVGLYPSDRFSHNTRFRIQQET